jgi:hypothetical protein
MPQPEAAIESKINRFSVTSDFTSPIFELYRKDYILFTLIASGTVQMNIRLTAGNRKH